MIVFWAMAQSGLQKKSLNANELAQRDSIQQWLSQTPNSLHQDGGIQRFAAVLLFNQPGSVRLSDQKATCRLVHGRLQALLLHGTSLTV